MAGVDLGDVVELGALLGVGAAVEVEDEWNGCGGGICAEVCGFGEEGFDWCAVEAFEFYAADGGYGFAVEEGAVGVG